MPKLMISLLPLRAWGCLDSTVRSLCCVRKCPLTNWLQAAAALGWPLCTDSCLTFTPAPGPRLQAAAHALKIRSKIISLRAPTSVNCFSFAFYTPVAATSKIHNPFPHLVAQAPLFDSIHESKSSPTHITNQLKFSPRQLSFSYCCLSLKSSSLHLFS